MITVIDGVSAKLKAYIKSLKKSKEPMYRAMGKACVVFTKQTFNTNGGNIGVTWAPLAASTANAIKQKRGKIRRGYGHILRDTGSAYGKISFNVMPNGVEWGFPASVNYMKYHQEGTPHMPKRQVMGTSPALENKIRRIAIEFYKAGK